MKVGDKVRSNDCPEAPSNNYKNRIGTIVEITNHSEWPINVKVTEEILAYAENELELIDE
jgi:hypothetical protein